MVMNTFRSKLRRRRNELFRRSSDEDSDEWQFVAFNPSVYPSQPSGGAGSTPTKTNTVAATLNGNYMTKPSVNHSQSSPGSNRKSTGPSSSAGVLRPWALKRASWHDSPPPVPPHGQGYNPKGQQQRPLPACPEVAQAPIIPPHSRAPTYPGSIPNWYGSRLVNTPKPGYPLSVPSGQVRPTHLEGIKEQPPIVLRRDISQVSSTSRPNSDEDESPISPEGLPPRVPPHGRPIVPQHFHSPTEPPAPVPLPHVNTRSSIPPPPPPPHTTEFVLPLEMEDLSVSLLSQPLPPSPQEDSSSSESHSSKALGSPAGTQVTAAHSLMEGLDEQGEKVCAGVGPKEQRRSDPGGSSGGQPGSLANHQNPTNGATVEDDQQHSKADDTDHGLSESQSCASFDNPLNNVARSQNSNKKRTGSSINRSESCKEKQHARKQARENRKNSDPNIPTSKTGDVDGENPLSFHSGSSSNSSLSQSQESPSGNSAEQVEAYASALDNDSDIEADVDLPDWAQRLSLDVVEQLSSKDRKRQDTINELFHTEQSHVRVLKVLQYLFHQPLRQSGYLSTELLDRLFPNLDQMLKFHTSFNKLMKKRRQESPLVNAVGDILSAMFEGEEGAQFQQAAAEFVACQGFALESLKQHQKRDQKLSFFLQDQENHPHCRRLQLKDMLPAGFQRLSKYPLLLESLLSYTDRTKQCEEHEQIARALDRSREILATVNAAVHDAENHKRLREIQKRLDQSALVKNKHGTCEELKGELDLTKHKLIYEGPLTWKTARGQKNIDLHVLILEDCVVLLQKDNDKYVLKYHSMNKSLGKDDNKLNLSPIIKFGTFLCREVATGDLRTGKTSVPCDTRRPSRGEAFLKDVFSMRRGSMGAGAKGVTPHTLAPLEEVVLRGKNPIAPPAVGPGFMRRSCTFVTEGSWRKSSFGIGSGQKETKDRLNLALQVRKKAAQLGGGTGHAAGIMDEGDPAAPQVVGASFHHPQGRSSGRVSRFVGNLKSWSSSEDVRQSVVGALTRTVNVIKQRPGSKKVKQVLSKDNGNPAVSPQINPPSGVFPTRNPATAKTKVRLREPSPSSSAKGGQPLPKKTPIPKKRGAAVVEKGTTPLSNKAKPGSGGVKNEHQNAEKKKWLRHLHDAQVNYTRDSRNRRPHPPPHLPDPDESTHPTDLRDVEDVVEADNNSESVVDTSSDGGASLQNKQSQDNLDTSFNSTSGTSPTAPQILSSPEVLAKKTESGAPSSQAGAPSFPQGPPCASQSSGSGGPRRRMQEVQIIQIVEGPSLIQPSEVKVSQGVVLSAEPVLTPIELLRRKDLKIRQELEEKQNLIADILNIPRHDFESVADIAGEVGLSNKEPRELVLGAIYQAKKLQETLNDVQTVRDSDIIAAQACTDSSRGSLPLYHNLEATEKLLSISGALTQLLNSLMVLISERDEERERMRKELVASRERVHQLHMQQNLTDPTTSTITTISASSTDLPPPQASSGSFSISFQSQLSAPTPSSLEATSPHSSRPSSFMSVNSSVADQSDNADHPGTDEEGKSEDPANSSTAEILSNSETATEKCEESIGDAPPLTKEEYPTKDAAPRQEEDGSANT